MGKSPQRKLFERDSRLNDLMPKGKIIVACIGAMLFLPAILAGVYLQVKLGFFVGFMTLIVLFIGIWRPIDRFVCERYTYEAWKKSMAVNKLTFNKEKQ